MMRKCLDSGHNAKAGQGPKDRCTVLFEPGHSPGRESKVELNPKSAVYLRKLLKREVNLQTLYPTPRVEGIYWIGGRDNGRLEVTKDRKENNTFL